VNETRLAWIALFSLVACTHAGSESPGASATPDASPTIVESSTPAVGATPTVTVAATDPKFYEQGDAACPDGGKIAGTPPPGGTLVYCELDGKTHGPVAIFDDDGHVTHVATEIHGEYDGVAIDFYANGQPKRQTHYVAGKADGPVIGWREDGTKAYEGNNVDGENEGTFVGFDARGKEVGRYEMKRGNGREVHWHGNGTKSYEVEMVAGLERGLASTWHDNGTKASEASYVEGRKNGPYLEWDAAGQERVRGAFVDEQEDGTWTHRDERGAIIRVERFEDRDLVASIDYQGGRPLAKPTRSGACESREGLAQVFAAQTRGELDDAQHCVKRPVHFPGVVVIGVFAHDRGCMPDTAMVDCRWHKRIDGRAILLRAGWRRADAAAREQLAARYVYEIAETFGGDEPSVERRADGTFVVKAQVSAGPGMNGRTASWGVEYRITKDAKVTRVDS
jgi:antitoxin component YwqK of YwqJK toxin-antitoxin module